MHGYTHPVPHTPTGEMEDGVGHSRTLVSHAVPGPFNLILWVSWHNLHLPLQDPLYYLLDPSLCLWTLPDCLGPGTVPGIQVMTLKAKA